MSGHSKWENIKRKKGATDAARAKIFTKIGREIAVCVKEGGPDPAGNAKLRDLIQKAKSNNVPNDNIERCIKKAAGDGDKNNYESMVYEGYGPSGVAVIVECLTDNKNRTAGDVRHFFDKFGGNLGTTGCVSFMFTDKGEIVVENNGADEDKIMEDCFEAGADDFNMFDTPLLLNRNSGLKFEQKLTKRILDLLMALAAFVIALPFMIITAIAIKAYDGGPVFYRQKRLTTGGREFYVYKFRSMIVGAEKKSGAVLASENDKRITPVGKLIRKIRFDELPQLINILKGDMSFVGPRPERPEIAAKYEQTMPEFKYRLKTKAGLTGYAQVMGKYNTTPYDKLKMDLMYIERQSLLLDLRIMLMTVKIVFTPSATEGVKEKKAMKEK